MARIKLALAHFKFEQDEHWDGWSRVGVFLVLSNKTPEFKDCEEEWEKLDLYDDLCNAVWDLDSNLFVAAHNGGAGQSFAGSPSMFFRTDSDGRKLIVYQSGGLDV